ncbi:MAG: hypothetical protein II333_07915, partial [Clostridia bacterium]|nr:hypothetical protein [Clostridia bacterium]
MKNIYEKFCSHERLDDAIYNRNRLIETKLNCLIKDNPAMWNPGSVLETAVVAGTGELELAYGLIEQAGVLITKEYLKNYNELTNIDMTKLYRDQGATETLTILDKMYFGLPDFGFDHYESMTVLFYNGALLDRYPLEDPYELWTNDEWVIDKMTSMVTAVSSDENGDGQDDYPEIGSFLEAIAAYTHDYTLKEYTESAVIGKGLRDQNSVTVFRKLIQSRSFDLMHAFTFTGLPAGFCTAVKSGENF